MLPVIKECADFAETIGMPKSEGEKFFHWFESAGWVDKNGAQIVAWKSKMHLWKVTWERRQVGGGVQRVAGIHSMSGTPAINSAYQADSVIKDIDDELKRIHAAHETYVWDGGRKMAVQPEAQKTIAALKTRKEEVRKLKMGMK